MSDEDDLLKFMTPAQIASPGAPNASVPGQPDPAAPPPGLPPSPEQIAAQGNASIAPVNPGLPASVQPSPTVTGFDIAQANDPNIPTDKLSPAAAKARAIQSTILGANARAAAIARGGTGGDGKVSIAPPAPTPPEAGSNAGVTPIGPSAAAKPGAGAAPAFDMGIMPARGGGGPNKAMQGLLADQKASEQRVQGSLEGVKDAATGAQGSQGDLGAGAQAAMQNASDQSSALDAQRASGVDAANARAQALRDQATQDAAELNKKGIDPKRWWNSKDTAGKVSTAIGMALGAFGQAITKTGNTAADIMHKGIEQDVAAQKEGLDSEWKAIAQKTGQAKDLEARSQWMDDRLQHAQQFAYEKAKNTIAGYQAVATTDEQKAKLEQLKQAATQAQEGITQNGIARDMARLQAQAAAGNPLETKVQQILAKQAEQQAAARAEGKDAAPPLTASEVRNMVYGRGVPSGVTTGGAGGVSPKEQKKLDAKEAEKRQNAADAANTINGIGVGKSTSVFENPAGAVGRYLPASIAPESNQAEADDAVFNTYLKGAIAHGKMGARTPEAQQELMDKFLLQRGESTASKQLKKASAAKLAASLAGAGPAPGGAGDEK